MNITQVQKEDYLHHLIVNITKHEHYSQDMHTGAIIYTNANNDDMYCTPAWEQWEDPTAPFPADDNVKISVQWYDESENCIQREIGYVLQWDIDKDLEKYLSKMADFLNNQDNF